MAQRFERRFGIFSGDMSKTTDNGQTHAIMTTAKESFSKRIFIRGES